MTRRSRTQLSSVGFALFASFVTSSSMPAQQRDTLADTTRPFVRGGVYDKPFQTRLFGRTAIGGYAEAHARWQEVEGLKDDAGFEAKRFNLFTHTRVSDFVRIGAELEFEEGGRSEERRVGKECRTRRRP